MRSRLESVEVDYDPAAARRDRTAVTAELYTVRCDWGSE